jgi:hypothetical protein
MAKIKLNLIFFLFCISIICQGQNIVPNASFEEVYRKQCNLFANPEEFEASVKDWMVPTRSVPVIPSTGTSKDCWTYIDTVSYSYYKPRTGENMASICVGALNSDFRSYLQGIHPIKYIFIFIYKSTSFAQNR